MAAALIAAFAVVGLPVVTAGPASAMSIALAPGQGLLPGQELTSPAGQYTLVMADDGNLTVDGNGCVIWASGTSGAGNHLIMQGDGNLVIDNGAGNIVWASDTAGTGSGDQVALQDDGNLVISTGGGMPVWASGAGAADRLCAPASMKAGQYIHSSDGRYKLIVQADGNLVIYGPRGVTWSTASAGSGGAWINLQADGNFVLYASGPRSVWASNTDGSGPGARLVMQDDGNLVLYSSAGHPLWASNTVEPQGGLPPARYVALGDSVPYGHGLANPNKGEENGHPADQPPSTQAWPSVVAAGLPGLAPLQGRQDGCSLTGGNGAHFDNLAVSGASSIDNQWTGSDGACPYPQGTTVPPHKAVFPDEVAAASLQSAPPALVTIQAGADDIHFSDCLKSLLQLSNENCVNETSDGYSLTGKVQAELDSLSRGLTDTVQAVKAQAPSAQIVLVGYYQIVPAADASLKGTSFACSDLRFSNKNSQFRTSIRAKADYLQQQLNNTISAVATKYAGVSYFDISDLFRGHEMCTDDSWVLDARWDAAHPNAVGQLQIGQAVIAACGTLANRCIG